MAVRDKFNRWDDTALALPAGSISKRAETFIAQYSYNCRALRLKLYRVGSPGTLTVKIYEDDGGVPSASPEGTATYGGDTITTNTSGEWIPFDFGDGSEFAISSGTQYWAVLETPSTGDASNQVYWRLDSDNGYATGSLRYYYPTTWGLTASKDHLFELWTDFPWAAPSKPTNPTPANSATEIDFSAFGLSWEDGGNADTYNVYIGEIGNTTLVSSTQVGISYTTNLSELEIIFGASPIDQIIYWRVDATNSYGTTTGDEWNFDARPLKVTNPSPTDAASGITLDESPLSWDASTVADTYEIYFRGQGDNWDLVGVAQAGVEWIITFGTLGYGTTYEWRVDAANEFGETTGDTWSFDTIPYEPPQISYILIIGGSGAGPYDDPPGVEGTDWNWTGESGMMAVRRLIVAANDSIWYEVL